MTLFPTIDNGEVLSKLDIKQPAAEVGSVWHYDHGAGQFVLVDGAPISRTGADAVREWIGLMLRVQRGKDKVFDGLDTTPGIDIDGLVGTRALPTGFARSELIREIRETLSLCPAIASADGFDISRSGRQMVIAFTVTLRTGEALEVTEHVGG